MSLILCELLVKVILLVLSVNLSPYFLIHSEGLDSLDDVEAVKDKVEVEIFKLRAHDSESTGWYLKHY